MRVHTEIGAYAFTAVMTGFTGFAASMQTLLSPASTWVPLGVLLGLLATAIAATVKVVRLIDGIRAEISAAQRERRRIAKELGIDLGRDE